MEKALILLAKLANHYAAIRRAYGLSDYHRNVRYCKGRSGQVPRLWWLWRVLRTALWPLELCLQLPNTMVYPIYALSGMKFRVVYMPLTVTYWFNRWVEKRKKANNLQKLAQMRPFRRAFIEKK